jgi:hypothetical protein
MVSLLVMLGTTHCEAMDAIYSPSAACTTSRIATDCVSLTVSSVPANTFSHPPPTATVSTTRQNTRSHRAAEAKL